MTHCISQSLVTAWLIASSLVLGGCGSQGFSPEAEAIRSRQEKFKSMGESMKIIDDQIKAGELGQEEALEQSEKVLEIARGIKNWFPPGSGPNAGVETRAKAEIWTDHDHFLKLHQEFLVEAEKFVLTATAEDVTDAALTSQYYATAVGCANCHDVFRVQTD